MRILSLDLSTKTGYAVLEDGILTSYGLIQSELKDFNVNRTHRKNL
jgi:hypothetical protein